VDWILKILIVALIAYVGYFFIGVERARRAANEEASSRTRLALCSDDQIASARAFQVHGKDAVFYGYPQAEENAKRCAP